MMHTDQPPTINTLRRDFSDERVFVVTTSDPRTHRMHALDHLGLEQSCDGPRYVVVGPAVSNEKLMRNQPELTRLYGVTLAQLQAVRDQQTPDTQRMAQAA